MAKVNLRIAPVKAWDKVVGAKESKSIKGSNISLVKWFKKPK